MMMGVVEKDKVQWEHTSNLIYAVFAPHMKKGTNISADRFNPYAKERMRIAAEKERERLKVFAASEVFKNLQERMAHKFSKPGVKTVWQRQQEKREKANKKSNGQ
jgi:hypothetical protein